MRRSLVVLTAALALSGCVAAPAAYDPAAKVVAGGFQPGRQPDGNSVLLQAPRGLIVVDTGRHPEHQAKILAEARALGRPVAAIVNTHWHLDHTGGNAELLAAYPRAEVWASGAVEGALPGFLAAGRRDGAAYLASGEADAAVAEDIRLDMAAVDAPAALRPTRVVTASGPATIAGRPLTVNLARHAATEGDVWIHDPATGTVIVGDLVTGAAPFLDTACPEGWRRALAEIAATPFERLIPGHGEPMSRSEFRTWRSAFAALVDCAEAGRPRRDCVAGWMWNAAPFIGEDEGSRVERLVAYYLETRLEPPAKRREHCPPT